MNLETIHESLVNGQKKQAVSQIKEYSSDPHTFFSDYKDWLLENEFSPEECFDYYSTLVLAFL